MKKELPLLCLSVIFVCSGCELLDVLRGDQLTTASEVADGISSIDAVQASATMIMLPEVPAGFTISIHSSSDSQIISLAGVIAHQEHDADVTLVFAVTRVADNSTAYTSGLSVSVPGVSTTAGDDPGEGDEPDSGDDPGDGGEPEITDWRVRGEAGENTYFESLAEAMSSARNPDNYRSIFAYKGKDLFATGSLLLVQNTNKPDDPVAATPLYDDLDLAYKDYYRKTSANAFSTIGPGGRGWHITYVYPLDFIVHDYTDKDSWWYKTNWPTENPDIPLEEQMFVKVALEGNRNLYLHADFVRELILLKDAADLHHVTARSSLRASKDGSETDYKEMVHVILWGEDMPDGSETHPEGAQPAEFRKKPDPPVYKNDGVPLCLAPSWMTEGVKYYTFDYHFFYTDMDDMYRDTYEGGHSRAVNAAEKFVNAYTHLNVFQASVYTIDEIYEYIDHRIDESQQYKNKDELSLLSNYLPPEYPFGNTDWPAGNPFPSQKETFRALPADSGIDINLAVMIAISEAESGFGRSKESHDDGDPFNHGTYWKKKGLIDQTDKIILEWPLYWKDQVDSGKKLPIIGPKRCINLSLFWLMRQLRALSDSPGMSVSWPRCRSSSAAVFHLVLSADQLCAADAVESSSLPRSPTRVIFSRCSSSAVALASSVAFAIDCEPLPPTSGTTDCRQAFSLVHSPSGTVTSTHQRYSLAHPDRCETATRCALSCSCSSRSP